MNQRNLAIGIAIVGLALYFTCRGGRSNSTRLVIDEEIVTDPAFDKLPDVLTKFNDCVRSDAALTECEKFIITNDDVFKDGDALRAVLPQARPAMKAMTSIEFLRPNGKVLQADTDKREISVYTLDAVGKYASGATRIHYNVVTQKGELKVNGVVIDRGPQ